MRATALFGFGLFLLATAGLGQWLLPGQNRQELKLAEIPDLGPAHQLHIEGINTTDQPLVLAIRVDDQPTPDYRNRANLERIVSPGPFQLQLSLGGLHTPTGRALDLSQLERIIVFQPRKKTGHQALPSEFKRAGTST